MKEFNNNLKHKQMKKYKVIKKFPYNEKSSRGIQSSISINLGRNSGPKSIGPKSTVTRKRKGKTMNKTRFLNTKIGFNSFLNNSIKSSKTKSSEKPYKRRKYNEKTHKTRNILV